MVDQQIENDDKTFLILQKLVDVPKGIFQVFVHVLFAYSFLLQLFIWIVDFFNITKQIHNLDANEFDDASHQII